MKTKCNSSCEHVLYFHSFIGKLPHKIKIVIAGNHETVLEPRAYGLDKQQARKERGIPHAQHSSDMSVSGLLLNYSRKELFIFSYLDINQNIC